MADFQLNISTISVGDRQDGALYGKRSCCNIVLANGALRSQKFPISFGNVLISCNVSGVFVVNRTGVLLRVACLVIRLRESVRGDVLILTF